MLVNHAAPSSRDVVGSLKGGRPTAKPRVYIETTVVSCLTARPNRDIVVAAQQQATHDWWQTYRPQFELITSQLIVQEASAGDVVAARERLDEPAIICTPEELIAEVV